MDREFLISQYASGDISDADREFVEKELLADPEVIQKLDDERQFTAFLRAAAGPTPDVRWEEFADRISSAVAKADAPATSYRLFSRISVTRMALAASVVLASAIGFSVYLRSQAPNNVAGGNSPVAIAHRVLVVDGPAADAANATGSAVAEITVGPPAKSAHFNLAGFSKALVTRPARVVIASGIQPDSEPSSSLPY